MTHLLSFPPSLSGRTLLRQAISINTELTLLLDPQCRVLFFNPAVQALLGDSAEILLGRELASWIHSDDQHALKSSYQRTPAANPAETLRVRVRQTNGEWLWVSASWVSFLNNPDVQATMVQFRPEPHHQDQHRQDQHRRALWEMTQVMNSTGHLSEVISALLTTGLQLLGASSGSLRLISADGRQLELSGQAGFANQGIQLMDDLPLMLRTPVTDVARSGEALFLDHQKFQTLYPDVYQRYGLSFQSAAALPLSIGERLIGVFALGFKEDHDFSAQEQTFFQMVASLCALALDCRCLSQELKREQDWSQAVNLNSSDIVTVFDDQGLIRYESGSIERILGYGATDLLGKSIYALIDPDHHARVQAALAQLSPGGDPVTVIFRCLHQGGHWIWLESIATDLRHQPHVSGVLANSRDVTAREEARTVQQDILDQLSLSERNFKRLADHSRDLVRQYALDGSVIYASPTAQDLLGYNSEDLLGPDPLHHVHEEDLPALEQAFQRRFTAAFEHEKFEYRLRRRDGTYVWVETVFKAVRDPETQAITAFVDTSRDIDQRKQAEQHLKVQLDRYHHLLDFTASLEQLCDPAALTAEALHKSLELTEYDYGYAFACSASGLTFEAQAGLNSAPISEFMDQLRLHAFTPLAEQAVRRGEAYFAVDEQAFLDPPEELPRPHWRSLCVLPILRQGTLMSLLVFGTSSRITTSQDTRQLLQNVAARLSHALERGHHIEQLNISREETLRALGLALEYRDYETKGHTDRVVLFTEHLGRALNFLPADQDALRWGAFLHDTGKVAIPDNILLKPGKLTPEEWTVIRRHPSIGYEMLHHIPSLPPATLEVVLYHQERWNGSGYPDGLQGHQIPLSARVFAVVDVYDALTSVRPYKRAWSHQEAAEQLRLEAGVLLDAAVVQTFLELFETDGSLKSSSPGEVPYDYS
ncbi:PAS domain S-box protein [Deinococcus detaillensis]|uniref:PAS domain S-box protein n=1 Tax=Deinococcus detaillensis TaxID=2592048 RepID=A0A553UP87_9DEIO|nr:PAS domain S-box protein [Deinococcus detaillensis]TSA82049.1 PAS domain S-box protein [Deinococcus detaillensis]